MRKQLNDNDFIVMWLLGALFLITLTWLLIFKLNLVVGAAYDLSTYLTTAEKEQLGDKLTLKPLVIKEQDWKDLETKGAIVILQDTFNPQEQ